MKAIKLGLLVSIVTTLLAGLYFVVYIYRWEMHRALIAGVVFLAGEIALATSLVLRRIETLRAPASEVARASAPEEDVDRGPVEVRAPTTSGAPAPFPWLGADRFGVFVPILLLYSVKLTFVVLGFAMLVGLVVMVLVGPFQRRLQELYRVEGERQALLVETVHGMRTVKSLALEPRQRRVWDDRSAETVSVRFRVDKISSVAQAIASAWLRSATGIAKASATAPSDRSACEIR